ncbi:MAG: Gfo/Idh/MocA family oxidoreductase [Haliscomenobacter sp.]|uniref:Gfo/Idh/MocA family protein n=1 Tax=Haliscomenobacter sp. TaxID=2717303 RepID=UPI0029B35D78|nr:Gfo/Idh/MocA family oxidoreductase [Haliscomenobacter sp.]MDX2071176.1 Gfo/Idh/MocA family oxidoreductase [Haliscomenobacter sp.]
MQHFALIGVAGYVAPRHLRAIKETGNRLIAAMDPTDSVGVLDTYFPEAAFFVEFERFDRHLEKFRQKGQNLHYVSICSPNYLHDAHIRFGLRQGADVICEKPLVLNPWNAEALQRNEQETGHKVFTILQLRLHPVIKALKQQVAVQTTGKKYDIDLTYITARGAWYFASWKGELPKSGGIATNIGIHFFDMLIWIFGSVQKSEVHQHSHDRAAGYLELEQARVRWFLSIDEKTLPTTVQERGGRTFRSIRIDGQELEFSEGFTDLHTESYKGILDGQGFGLRDAAPSIALVHEIREAEVRGLSGEYHPLAALPQAKHPFK